MADRDPGELVPFGDGGGGRLPALDPALLRSRLPMNDLGNARRFAELSGGRLLFCGDIGRSGCWLYFDGARWSATDGEARARSVALAVVDALQDEAKALRDAAPEELAAVYGRQYKDDAIAERRLQLFAWAMKSGNADRSAGMVKQAAALTDEGGAFVMRAGLDAFDTDPMAYNCINGVLRFEQVEGDWFSTFQPGHRASDMMMQMAGVAYDPDARCPLWLARLEQLHDDPVARTMLSRIYGSTLTGLTSDQAFYVYQGKGGDGKSMTNDVMEQMHGDYMRRAGIQTFLDGGSKRSGSDHQSDLVRLRGDVRLVVADEPKKGSTWNGERIKQVTGSKIVARAPNAVEELTFAVHWKLIVECNILPRAPSDDRGFRRRFRLLPWLKSYGVTAGLDDRPADEVKRELVGELSGILNWMIEGALAWLTTRTIPEPAGAALATSNYWSTGSALVEWMEANCDISDPEAVTSASDLYADFKRYCTDVRGDKVDMVMNQTGFGRAMNDRQHFKLPKDAAGRINRGGIRLKPDRWDGVAGAGGGGESGAGWREFSDDPGAWDTHGGGAWSSGADGALGGRDD